MEANGHNLSLIFDSLNYITVIVNELTDSGFGGRVLSYERISEVGHVESTKQMGVGCAYELHRNVSGFFYIHDLPFSILQEDRLRFDVRVSSSNIYLEFTIFC